MVCEQKEVSYLYVIKTVKLFLLTFYVSQSHFRGLRETKESGKFQCPWTVKGKSRGEGEGTI